MCCYDTVWACAWVVSVTEQITCNKRINKQLVKLLKFYSNSKKLSQLVMQMSYFDQQKSESFRSNKMICKSNEIQEITQEPTNDCLCWFDMIVHVKAESLTGEPQRGPAGGAGLVCRGEGNPPCQKHPEEPCLSAHQRSHTQMEPGLLPSCILCQPSLARRQHASGA